MCLQSSWAAMVRVLAGFPHPGGLGGSGHVLGQNAQPSLSSSRGEGEEGSPPRPWTGGSKGRPAVPPRPGATGSHHVCARLPQPVCGSVGISISEVRRWLTKLRRKDTYGV